MTNLYYAFSAKAVTQPVMFLYAVAAILLLSVNIILYRTTYFHLRRSNRRIHIIMFVLVSGFLAIMWYYKGVFFVLLAAIAGSGTPNLEYFWFISGLIAAACSAAMCWVWWGSLIALARYCA